MQTQSTLSIFDFLKIYVFIYFIAKLHLTHSPIAALWRRCYNAALYIDSLTCARLLHAPFISCLFALHILYLVVTLIQMLRSDLS